MFVKILWSVLVLMILSLQFRMWVGEGSYAHAFQLQEEIATQVSENSQLEARNKLLEAEVVELKQAQSAIEERARSQLGLVYENETLFLLAMPTTQ